MRNSLHPSFPHQPISFRTAYWLFLISLAGVCWLFLLSFLHLPPNAELRALLDESNRHIVVGQMFSVKTLLFRQGYWIIEELVFRGFLLQVLRRYLPLWLALFVSAAAFALTHFAKGTMVMTVAFTASYYFAWLMIRTNSIYAPIIAHWSIDFCSMYIYFPLLAASGRLSNNAVSLPPSWTWVLSAAVLAVGVLVLRREFRRWPGRDTGPETGRA